MMILGRKTRIVDGSSLLCRVMTTIDVQDELPWHNRHNRDKGKSQKHLIIVQFGATGTRNSSAGACWGAVAAFGRS